MKILLATCFVVLLATLSFAEETISPKEAWKLGWPTMQGPYGNYRVPQTGVKLVDDLTKAQIAELKKALPKCKIKSVLFFLR